MDRWLQALADLEDLEPEGATAEELEQVRVVRAEALRLQGLDAPPTGTWEAHFYLRATLLRFLRGREGDAAKAAEMLVDTIGWFSEQRYWEGLRKFEEEGDPQERELLHKHCPEGPFGVDLRGAPVLYARLGMKDVGGMIRETCVESTIAHHVYMLERNRFLLNEHSLRRGKALLGHVVVFDFSGMTWARAMMTVSFTVWMVGDVFKDRFPETIGWLYCVNVPWFFKVGWGMVAPFLPEGTKRKMRICRSGRALIKELESYVAPDQIPSWLGGRSPEPWPYGEGGDLPRTKDGEGLEGVGVEGCPVALEVINFETVVVEVPPGKTCIWEWSVDHSHIEFALHANGREVLAKRRVSSSEGWQSGKVSACKGAATTLTLTFDNSFWFTRRKRILYKTHLFDEEDDIDTECSEVPVAA